MTTFDLDLNSDMFFNIETTADTFMAHQRFNRDQYYKQLYLLLDAKSNIPSINLARILACTLGSNDNININKLLTKEKYKLPEILKACEILDSRRQIIAFENRINKLNLNKNTKKYKTNKIVVKLDYMKTINELPLFSLTRYLKN